MNTNREWMGISDLMTGLMMVFLFIAIAFMLKVQEEKKSLDAIAITYEETRSDLRKDLYNEFKNDLDRWGAEFDPKDITIRFKEPDVLFAQNSSEIKQKFRFILNEFFPRYLHILTSDKYKNTIKELRIEGHTSSIWRSNTNKDLSYINNARLSQSRSFSVLNYVYLLDSVKQQRDWLAKVIRANGLSYANRIFKEDNTEDYERSRRVEFRVITKSDEKIQEILEQLK